MPKDRYDCVIIGAGHNGLVAANYLARAGRKVCVLESRSVLGGCCSTEELWPGFHISPAAYVISLFLPEITRDLELARHGLEILPRDPSSFTPLPDGRSLLLGHDDASNRQQIAQFSQRDAEKYPQYEVFLTRVAAQLEPLLLAPPAALPPRLRDAPDWWRYHKRLRALGDDLPAVVELLTGAATPILERWFKSDVLRAVLATDAIIGAFASPSMPGSAYVLLHHVMGEAGGKRGVWGYVRGGMGSLAEALARSAKEHGAEIRTDVAVTSIDAQAGRVRGVTLEGGEEIPVRCVASSLDAQQTFLKLLGEEHLSTSSLEAVKRIDYSSASAKINLALNGLPDIHTGDTDPRVALRGTIHIAPTLEYIERAFDDAKYGRPSRQPVLEITIPSVVDTTLAPPGKHVLSMFVQYAPYRLREGSWDDASRAAFADSCIDILAEYAPNIRDIVLETQVLLPVDLERIYGLTGGNIFQGAMNLHQLGPFRSGYRTTVQGLWLCGAATHPGGGVMGVCGRNAAREILRG